ncbi:hypothetical protein N7517_004254 [Penicillium concentricum]|uniref:Uncharacterized protein n=1 Tax=Penicillium concentricum TaxID=293559 RepID=A0A9W9V7Z9_9EURO|nr:uncharacterized protein N7517_004254 [Penicillium concentricum]KAJ5372248.1 hypothetical protein N7517_004254 [Penicillium concentricum]
MVIVAELIKRACVRNPHTALECGGDKPHQSPRCSNIIIDEQNNTNQDGNAATERIQKFRKRSAVTPATSAATTDSAVAIVGKVFTRETE